MANTSGGSINEHEQYTSQTNRNIRESRCENREFRNEANEQMELLINEEEESQKHPWKIIYQNIRSLISENSRKKIDYFNDYVYENKIILMNFTETWLTEEIQEEATINGYNEFRGDRKETKQGGTAIHLHSKTQGELITSYSKNKCEMIAIKVKS